MNDQSARLMSDVERELDTDLYRGIREVLLTARITTQRAVNDAMVQAYWHIGRMIVEDEQGGAARAEYGRRVLPELAKRLAAEFGKGFSTTNLKLFRQFYLAFPMGHTLCDQSGLGRLSWSHFRNLLRVESVQARMWYANEAASQNWSVRALDRQISTLYYERLLSSSARGEGQDGVRDEAAHNIAAEAPPDARDFIRDPYVLEFLGVQPGACLYEQDVEQGLIERLQQFLMELGKGFAFVARQKRVQVEGDNFFVDLVFYNYLLKCFVLIDLKVGKLTHQDVGQLDMYVRVFDEQERGEGDNPTIGLILCSERNAAVAKYSALADKPQLFASKYQMLLPTEEELRIELERDRAWLESAQGERKIQ
ncbi:MAG: PDDEXK nuclease domain-containing protein [Halothiobacillaceae bacterium]|nr:PDDEXK nuclease domain-containing protein [Halothiobacillaceae bacterium]